MYDNSLPRKMMLKKSSEFYRIFQQGSAIKNEYFSIFFVKESELKVGFAVSLNCKSRPKRNKLKRIARELWRSRFRYLYLPAHLVIVITERIIGLDHSAREELFKRQLQETENRLQSITVVQ